MRRIWTVVALAACACGSASNSRLDGVERSSGRSEAITARSEELYELTAADQQRVRALTEDMVQRARSTIATFEHAAQLNREATSRFDAASADYRQAAADYETARQEFVKVATALVAAAASDLVTSSICGPRVSTRAYRRQLRREGVDLSGKDIDHIFPRSHGGADQPWNYAPLESSINRSLGDGGLLYKLSHLPLSTLRAYAFQALSILACAG